MLKSAKTFFQEPGLLRSISLGGAITMVRPPNSLISLAVVYVFPRPTTSDIKQPP